MSKRCSGCKHYQQLPDYGLCEKFDWRVDDANFSCPYFKGKKFNRVEQKRIDILTRGEQDD